MEHWPAPTRHGEPTQIMLPHTFSSRHRCLHVTPMIHMADLMRSTIGNTAYLVTILHVQVQDPPPPLPYMGVNNNDGMELVMCMMMAIGFGIIHVHCKWITCIIHVDDISYMHLQLPLWSSSATHTPTVLHATHTPTVNCMCVQWHTLPVWTTRDADLAGS